jgi:hypothetical protein
MGIIRKIGFICLLFWALNLSAQTAYDTVYFSQKQFVKHVVKGGESLTSIAALHKVKISEIQQANELAKRLYYKQLLYIPIYLTNKDEESISVKKLILEERDSGYSITHIALLMPYYLLKNDTMFNRDTLDVSDRYYIQSEDALSFHIGVELAIDSLTRAGKKIVLHTFDTNKDSVQVRKIVASNQLNEMDIIIGPMHSNLFQILCQKYGQDATKILISPLSRDNKAITQFPAVYQIALTYKAQAELLANYLIKNKLDERIIILNDKKEEGIAISLKDKFKKHNKTVESFEITSTNIASITKYFAESQNILLLSRDQLLISQLLSSIAIDTVSTVYTFESIASYDNLEINNLMKVDVHIPFSRSIDASNDYDLNFLELFEKEYPTNVRKYSKEGFDIIMHFCGSTSIFDFKQSQTGYFQNISVPIYHYLDYELVPIE